MARGRGRHKQLQGSNGKAANRPAAAAAAAAEAPLLPHDRPAFDQACQLEDVLAVAVVACVSLAVYTRTLYPSVAGGDSGELVAQSCTLGIAHPPGYPLFTLLSHAAVHFLPPVVEPLRQLLGPVEWGGADAGGSAGGGAGDTLSPAWYSNFFSAACDAAAATLVSRTAKLLAAALVFRRGAAADRAANVLANLAGVSGGLLFACSPLVWSYAVGSEVFALNNALMAALVHTMVTYGVHGSLGSVYLGAFLCGLGLCNQHTAVLFELPVVVWVAWRERSRMLRRPGAIALAVLCGLAGLAPHAYLPWSALRNGQAGVWGDLATPGGFWHHLARADYGTFQLYAKAGANPETPWSRTAFYLRDLVNAEATSSGAAAAAVGAVALLVRGSGLGGSGGGGGGAGDGLGPVVLALPVFYLAVFHTLSNMPLDEELLYGVHERFWQQPNLVVFTLVGVGVAVLFAVLRRIVGGGGGGGGATLCVGLALPLVGATVAAQVARSFGAMDRSDAWFFRDYVHGILGDLPQNAVYLAAYDIQWTAVVYMQKCEGFRPDVAAFNIPMLSFGWHRELQQLSPGVAFPGDYMNRVGGRTDLAVTGGREANLTSFDLGQFLRANMDTRAVFAGGDHIFVRDKVYGPEFEFVPDGYRLRAVRGGGETTRQYYAKAEKAWAALRQSYGRRLPPESKYTAKTWEWTTRVDYWRKLEVYSAELLARAVADKDGEMIVAAVRVLEELCVNEVEDRVPLKAIKNLGLGYARLVQEKALQLPSDLDLFRPFDSYGPGPVAKPRVFNPNIEYPPGLRWKLQASLRTLEVWGFYVTRAPPDDADVPVIEKTVEVLQRAMMKSKPPQR